MTISLLHTEHEENGLAIELTLVDFIHNAINELEHLFVLSFKMSILYHIRRTNATMKIMKEIS